MTTIRRLIPSLPPITRNRVAMAPLDLIDFIARSGDPELRGLPPNRMRIRTGVGNKVLGNGKMWFGSGGGFWIGEHAAGRVNETSSIVEIGCGCGRCAIPLVRKGIGGKPFTGKYIGLDVDAEMLGWCTRNIASDRFSFARVRTFSAVYNPEKPEPVADSGGSTFPVDPSSTDLVFALSVFSHLLEGDFVTYLKESRRVLRPGGHLVFTTFCPGHVESGPNARWTFAHRMGAAHVESVRYPEAATAYEEGWVLDQCAAAGFERVDVIPTLVQTRFVLRAV